VAAKKPAGTELGIGWKWAGLIIAIVVFGLAMWQLLDGARTRSNERT